jgi:hypothetical protein
MARNLKSVSQFAGDSPFTEPSIRWMIFNADTNGLAEAGAVVRIGRRVYIDPEAFDRWIDSQQGARVQAGAA